MFRKAVLMIHGFAGGTYDQEELANHLELNRDFDVFQFTLPGHRRNLSKVEYHEWISASERQVEWLIENGYNKIYLVAHSMGGIIATYLSCKYKQIKKIVLAAPAFHYLNVENNDLNLGESVKVAPKIIKDYGGDEIIGRLLKLNIVVLKEFIKLAKEYYNYPKELTCSLLILHGKNDNLVPVSSSEYVYESAKSKEKKLILLEDVTHDIFRSKNKEEIFKIVEEFLKD